MRTTDPEKVRRARGLVASGKFSLREVARAVGLPRGTVEKIAAGERVALRRKPERDPEGERPIERCPVHGVLVEMPCIQCQTEAYIRGRKKRRGASGVERGANGDELPAEGRP